MVRYALATRLNSFRSPGARSIERALAAVATVEGISAVELNYPQHLTIRDDAPVIERAKALGLAVTAINLRFDPPNFSAGAYTHPSAAVREQAFSLVDDAVGIAAANGIGHVILWMGPDGFDYPFQADYAQLWEWEIDGFKRAAAKNPAARLSVEYKPSDPRRTSLIRSMSDALLAARDVGAANFGVTIDFCHSLMAGERPAAAAAQAIRSGKLFGVHLNDGYGAADDGLMVGSVHWWETLELLWALRRGQFVGTLYFDTFPDRLDPAAECAANVAAVAELERILDRIDAGALAAAQDQQDAIRAAELIREATIGLRP